MSNYKYNTKDLYEATNGGLDILEKHYSRGANKKHFKLNDNEDTASAIFYDAKTHWVIKDFSSGKSYDAVSAVMLLKGIEFKEAIQLLYTENNLAGAKTVVSSNITFKENTEKLPKTYFKIEVQKEYPNLDAIGKFVTPEIAKAYNLVQIKTYEKITAKEGKLMITEATPNYPIFAYSDNLKKWAKTYKPSEYKRLDKNGKTVNFKHGYLGAKPQTYVHGLERILKDVDEDKILKLLDEIKEDRASFYSSTDAKEKKRYQGFIEYNQDELKKLRLENIIICSGGSDGLNLASISDDYYPIWFNSEGEQITYDLYQRLNKLCKNFYNLPDIDIAGKKYAHTLSNNFWNIKTIWLPVSKMGTKGKDFRDWLKYYGKAEKEVINRAFDKMLNYTVKCNFIDKNDKNRPAINLANFHYFLNCNNFYSYKEIINFVEKSNDDTSFLIKIDEYKVSVPEVAEIRNFCIEYLKDKGVDLTVINLIKASKVFIVSELKAIDRVSLDFDNYTHNSQQFYFQNGIVNITKDAVGFSTKNITNKFVWNHKVSKYDFRKTADYFEYYKDVKGENRVKINDTSCEFMAYLMNASRVHWRKEIEDPYESVEEQEAYRAKNMFTLNGENLGLSDQITQEKHFLNKCFAIGYLLHNYKREDFTKFVYIMDDAVKDSEDDADGGSGKSLLVRGLKELLSIFSIDGKKDDIKTDRHIFGELQPEHDAVNVEDGNKKYIFDFFFGKITGEIECNPKHKKSHNIAFKDAGKFVGTFNYGMPKDDGSTNRRILFVSFSNWYHAKTKNFKKERKVSTDFGRTFFQQWDEKQYNKFYNFLMQCCKLYLNNIDNEFLAPMDNISQNNLKASIGDAFITWADEYFIGEENFNRNLYRSNLFDTYKSKIGKYPLGSGKFKEALELYCALNGYTFNPKRFLNSQGKIKVNITEGQKRSTKECFYIEKLEIVETEKPEITETFEDFKIEKPKLDDLEY
ncbi:hypothetical protein G1K53_11775 [Tenacibaculum finnmarkense]|uniref:hypothetical protein n=1 Tax=Tenacibaculum finnmarkense TaxID=2781243 RepID=UPI001EFA3209|nr:hypothetical protein [Tenacibaculum finnmarkense]MCG8208185.1 hypothetical protein [Tenacibaculum finnmarkense genomovar finnmarkense]MCG8742512.1 hypothetical protein [Tenacibaculum finnmarkense]MCG8765912.1 hypothetical protein [Tenacibaculum finnmarkense]MCM8907340.1 hypothetical protein [Tenacibaculum finnmarkense genomovar finnmarkense]